MSDDIVVVDNGQTYETSESAIVAKNEADRAEQWAKYSEEKANLADERAIDAAESSDAAAQAATAAIAAKEYAENAITDNNLITVAIDLKATPSNIKTVAGSIANVNVVSENIDNVNAVAGNAENINAVNANKANIDTVSNNIDSVNDVAMIKDDVVIVSESASDIMMVADNVEDVKNVSNNMQDVKKAVVSAANAKASEDNAKISENHAQTWAEGEDPDVAGLGGTHSAKKWAELAGSLVNVQPASETTSGIVRLSTTEEAKEGFDDSTAITPLKLAQVVADNVGRGIQLGFNGTLEGNVLTFETTDPSPYTLRHNYDYEIDLLFQAVGVLSDDVEVVIKNGSDYINIVNVLHDDPTTHITVGDIRQLMKYNDVSGWRWVFMARYAVTANGNKVFVMPSTVGNITDDVIYNRLGAELLTNPDMIRYENDNGYIKIKAGSTFVKPNGVGIFEKITIPNDITISVIQDDHQIIFSNGTQLFYINENNTFSQPTAPTAYSMMLWYDTTENKIKYTGNSGSTWTEGYCFPFGTADKLGIKDCFCNGIGYFASCVWVLDGVNFLIPNGKNKDGTPKNIKHMVSRTQVYLFDDTISGEWALTPSGVVVDTSGFTLTDNNYIINNVSGSTVNGCPLGRMKRTTGRIDYMSVRDVMELSTNQDIKNIKIYDYDFRANSPRFIEAKILKSEYKNKTYIQAAKANATDIFDKTSFVIHPCSIRLNVNGVSRWYVNERDTTIMPSSILDSGSALQAGKDYYIYLVPDGAETKILCSLNASYPSGFTAENSRKIGGFHTLCVNSGTLSNNIASGYAAGNIIPNSIWCLGFRPAGDTRGAAYIDVLDKWGHIYLQSGTGDNTTSAYGATITDTRYIQAHIEDMLAIGYCLPGDSEFTAMAWGSNQETNVNGSVDPVTTGGHTDTKGRRMISTYFLEDCCGALWQWLSCASANGGNNWNEINYTGSDFYASCLVLRAGGHWASGAHCGWGSRDGGVGRSTLDDSSSARGLSQNIRLTSQEL